jgi:protein-tyrosine kinase
MSTIEKAVEKLERRKTVAKQVQAPVVPGKDTLEKVVSAETDMSAGPALEKAAVEVQRAINPNQSAIDLRADTTAPVPGPVVAPQLSAAEARGRLELPLALLADKGMVTPIAPRSRVAEEYRTIKRPLLRNIGGAAASPVDNANLIMVTSALQGDGKTFTAINLAISIAMEQDKTVLFVDADVAKASAGSMLGVADNSPGLIDVLEGKGITVADVIMPTSIDNLRLIPAGNIHERSTELLAGPSMHQLMLELSSRYSDRVIVFDSPPLLLTTEASVLASFMGQIVFVVSTDETPSEAVTEALEHVGGDKIIGMVLNKAHSRRSKLFGLGYGYGYGDGYGYGYGSKRQARSAEQDG